MLSLQRSHHGLYQPHPHPHAGTAANLPHHMVSAPWFARTGHHHHHHQMQQHQQHLQHHHHDSKQRSLSPDTPDELLEDEDEDFADLHQTGMQEYSFYEDSIGKDHQQVLHRPAKTSPPSFRDRYPLNQHLKRRPSSSSGSTSTDELELPTDPRTWLREDVQTWIRQMSDAHGLPSVQSDRFLMNGKALCLMTMDMFCQRVPLGGKMLFKDFQLRLSMAMYHSSSSSGIK